MELLDNVTKKGGTWAYETERLGYCYRGKKFEMIRKGVTRPDDNMIYQLDGEVLIFHDNLLIECMPNHLQMVVDIEAMMKDVGYF